MSILKKLARELGLAGKKRSTKKSAHKKRARRTKSGRFTKR
jgi:hypothetical protein